MVNVVLVDEKDNSLGLMEKTEAHKGDGKLHRAFTILIFNEKGEVLIARRSLHKMLWPMVWDNACASHPLENESYIEAGKRRLLEELGFSCDLKEVDRFTYHESYSDIGSENELCVTLIGNYSGDINPSEWEVADYKWVSVEELKIDMKLRPTKYTIWFKIALDRLIDQGKI